MNLSEKYDVSDISGIDSESWDRVEYMEAGETINAFQAFLRSAVNRYENNAQTQVYCEQDQEDILHEIELGSPKNAYDGYRLYCKLRETRIERRRCKHENDVLEPIAEYIKTNKRILEDIDRLQKTCYKRKEQHKHQKYTARGNVLKQMGFSGML